MIFDESLVSSLCSSCESWLSLGSSVEGRFDMVKDFTYSSISLG